MQVRKIENKNGFYDFELIEENKKLMIMYCRDFDLYFLSKYNDDLSINQNDILTYDIDRKNNEIFQIFDSLYCDVLNGHIYELQQNENLSEVMINKNNRAKELLIDENDSIVWVSDDETCDIFKMSKINNDLYRLYLIRKTYKNDEFKSPFAISVRFSNSNSKYKPYNVIFMRLYDELQNINCEQIDNNEYTYTKKPIK